MLLDASWALIFGGCCSNVFTLEAIVKHEPDCGLLLTVNQFLLTSIFALPTQLSPSTWRLLPTSIPLERLALMALLFFGVNMLNNWAFAFSISVPMHIILRSFGSVQTLAVGWLCGRRYSRVQVGSVAALTVGVVTSAWADAKSKGASMSLTSTDANGSYAVGIMLLFTAQLISAFMGIYTEQTYATYGRHWREILFYSHFFGLLFSLAMLPTLSTQFYRLLSGPPASLPPGVFTLANSFIPTSILSRYFNAAGAGGSVPKSAVLLLLNGLTQVACISGVNLLSARTSAVTVTVVLNIRKLVSFLLSCVIFGNPVSGMSSVGAAIVFVSGAVYGWDESVRKSEKGKVEEKVSKGSRGTVKGTGFTSSDGEERRA